MIAGPWGAFAGSILRGGTTFTISTSSNPAARCLLFRNAVSSTESTGCFFAVSQLGFGWGALWGKPRRRWATGPATAATRLTTAGTTRPAPMPSPRSRSRMAGRPDPGPPLRRRCRPRGQRSRTVAATPKWSEAHSGGAAWNGWSPTRRARTGLARPWLRTRSIREVATDAGFASVASWQQE